MSLSDQSDLMSGYPVHKSLIRLSELLSSLSLKAKLLAGHSNPEKLEYSLTIFEYINRVSEQIESLTMALRFHSDNTPSILSKSNTLIEEITSFTKDLKF